MTTATLTVKAAARRPLPLPRLVRDLHAWIGALIAPSVLFFALTGILQVWSLHESHGGYRPPPLIEKLGVLHKKQAFAIRHRAGPPAAPAHQPAAPAHAPDAPKPATLLLRAFFTLVAVGLMVSTVAGMWMAITQSPSRRTLGVLMLIGAVTPIVLAALTT